MDGLRAAITDNIHIGSGIINITPPICHPARVAEKVAMLDQLAPGRFEFGTGRGSSSTEVFGFGIDSIGHHATCTTRRCREIIKMMGPDEYGPYEGHLLLAAASPGAAETGPRCRTRRSGSPPVPRARSRRRRGWASASCASPPGPEALKPLIDIYKNDDRGCGSGRRLREQQRDGHHRDDDAGRRRPRPRGVPHTTRPATTRRWSQVPRQLPAGGWDTTRHRSWHRRSRWSRSTRRSRWVPSSVGTPEEAIKTMRGTRRSAPTRCRSGPCPTTRPSTPPSRSVETFGKFVLPEFDKDPVHSTTRQREAQIS